MLGKRIRGEHSAICQKAILAAAEKTIRGPREGQPTQIEWQHVYG
jgi:hypothetical protein